MAMGNARIVKFVSFGNKAMTFVEWYCMGLGIESTPGQTPFPGDPNQRLKHAGTDTTPAPGPQHGHAPDVSIFEQASRTDSCPTLHKGNDMCTGKIEPIPFQLDRHTLLHNKHALAD